jgi:hypothetical protein
VHNPAAGWYRGDFHSHTNSSWDGRYGPPELAGLARQQGLDFLAITDHNTIKAFDRFGDDPGLLVIPGLEVTTTVGHWNVFGLEGSTAGSWQEWMQGICEENRVVNLPPERATSGLMQEIAGLGCFNSINHPFLKPWQWRDMEAELAHVHGLEIWNDYLWPDSRATTPEAVAFWTRCLNAGLRLTGIGGSDFHLLPGDREGSPGEYLGAPATWVCAEQLSGEAILDGLRRGRAYVTNGPRLAFKARCNGETFEIGDNLPAFEGVIEFTASAFEVEGAATARLVQNGQVVQQAQVGGGRAELGFSLRPAPGQRHWFRFELLGSEMDFLALTNPIFSRPLDLAIQTEAVTESRFGDFLV